MEDHHSTLYVQVIEVKDHTEVCLPFNRLLSGHLKFELVLHENNSTHTYLTGYFKLKPSIL